MHKLHKEREESFGAVVFASGEKDPRVLLVRTDHWGFPKGHAELGEDGLQAAIREVREETGIVPAIADASRTLHEEYEIRRDGMTTKKTVTYWIGEGSGEVVARPGEIAEARWTPIDETPKLLSYESAKRLFVDAVRAWKR